MDTEHIPRRRRPVFDSRTKAVEWLMTAFMIGWGITLSIPGTTFSISSYRDFVAIGIDESSLATFFLVIATIRGITLYMNGRMAQGPAVRLFCSIVGAMTWLLTALKGSRPARPTEGHFSK